MERENSTQHPGSVLMEELIARGLTQKDFADEIQVAYSQLNEVIKGKRNITADLAILLEAALGIEAMFWLNLQNEYDLAVSKMKPKNKIAPKLEKWQEVREFIPYSFFKKVGVITGNITTDENKIKDLYKISSLDKLPQLIEKASVSHKFRKTETLQENKVNVFGWLNLVNQLAETEQDKVNKFEIKKKDELISKLRGVFSEEHVIEKTTKLLNEAGIKMVIQDKPEKTPVDGVAFWQGKNPVVALTRRHKRLDNFAFTLFHELGHIYLHGNTFKNKDLSIDLVDNLDDYTFINRNKEEIEANEFASNKLIPKDEWENFTLENYEFSDESIEEFAEKTGIHPAIVVGRLRFENPVLYSRRFRISNEVS